MGLFSKIFGREGPAARFASRPDPNGLLKEATALKKAGNLDAAIAKLREAYAAISTTNFTYDVKPFLRLPLYLQEAGRNDEAWKELNNLLLGFPNQLRNNEVLPMTHSIVYDKMRLFLQREKKVEKVVLFSMFSYLCWMKGLSLQSRRCEFKECIKRTAIELAMEPAIRTARMTNLAPQLVDIVEREAARAPHIDLRRVEEEFKIVKGYAEISPETGS